MNSCLLCDTSDEGHREEAHTVCTQLVMYEPRSLRGMLHTMLNTAEQHLVEGQPGVGAAEARALLKDARAWACKQASGAFDRTQLERLAILELRSVDP